MAQSEKKIRIFKNGEFKMVLPSELKPKKKDAPEVTPEPEVVAEPTKPTPKPRVRKPATKE